MAYTVRFPRETKEELEVAYSTYPGFREQITEWLGSLAEKVESRDRALSFELTDLASETLEATGQSWRPAFRRFLKERAVDKFWAFLAFLRTRRPPWEFRTASRVFMVSSSFWRQITVIIEIDHVKQMTVFRYFDGLPGQD